MRRADRLFQIVQLLRTRRQMTAAELADRLEVSVRTVYRDVQDLSLSGIPIIAQTGEGYRLDKSYNLPPLTFGENELEALILGARMVQAWSDRQMATEATRALQRIESVLPEPLKAAFASTELLVPAFHIFSDVAEKLPPLRQAIKRQTKMEIDYRRADGQTSLRTVWPLGLFFWGKVWTLVAWCELRDDYRQFRIDRIQDLTAVDSQFKPQLHQTLDYYLLMVCDNPDGE
jgi:predicted DNA-binding transcriptional regulator YafY